MLFYLLYTPDRSRWSEYWLISGGCSFAVPYENIRKLSGVKRKHCVNRLNMLKVNQKTFLCIFINNRGHIHHANLLLLLLISTDFGLLFPFYTPWKHWKSSGNPNRMPPVCTPWIHQKTKDWAKMSLVFENCSSWLLEWKLDSAVFIKFFVFKFFIGQSLLFFL